MSHTIEYINGWYANKWKESLSNNPYSIKTQTKSYREWEDGWIGRVDMFKHETENMEIFDKEIWESLKND